MNCMYAYICSEYLRNECIYIRELVPFSSGQIDADSETPRIHMHACICDQVLHKQVVTKDNNYS